jgi:membrane protein YdbS with pleckstrin-like domain
MSDGTGATTAGLDSAARTPAVRLREPANLVSPRARLMWTSIAAVQMLILLALQLGWLLLDDAGPRTPHWVVGALFLVFAVTYVVVMPVWRYRVHRWETTPTAVYTQTGWLTQERRIAPLSRIQTVDMARGPVSQLFRLASVTVTTASAAGPLRIHGLDVFDARRLVDELTDATVGETGDAT